MAIYRFFEELFNEILTLKLHYMINCKRETFLSVCKRTFTVISQGKLYCTPLFFDSLLGLLMKSGNDIKV